MKIFRKKIPKLLLLYILILALFLRIVGINQSFWLDEAIGANAVSTHSYQSILVNFPKGDNHPPLYYLTLKAWTDVFGQSEPSFRSLSLVFALLTIIVTYKIAELLSKNKSFPIISALLVTTSQFHVYYSQEARMYMMAAFFAVLSVYSFIKTLKNDRDIKSFVIFSLAITALVFTDYVPVFLLPFFWIYAAIYHKNKKWWKNFLLAHLPLVLLGSLWLPIFIYQSQRGRWLLETLPAWSRLAGGATFKQAALVWIKFVLGRISFLDKAFYYTLISIISIPIIYIFYRAYKNCKEIKIVWYWLLAPLIIGFITSFMFPAFIYFRFVYLTSAFYLLLSWGIVSSKNFIQKLFLVAFILLVNFSSWLLYINEPYQQRERWRHAVEFIDENIKENEIVLFENPEPFAPFTWYVKKAEGFGGLDSISANREKTYGKAEKLLQGVEGVYYFEYLKDLHDPQGYLLESIVKSGFYERNKYNLFPGVGEITYFERI